MVQNTMAFFWKKATICYAFISSNHFFHTPRSLVCLVLTKLFWIQCIYCPALTNCKKRHTHTHIYIYIYLFIYIYIYILFRIVYGSLSINPMCQVYLHWIFCFMPPKSFKQNLGGVVSNISYVHPYLGIFFFVEDSRFDAYSFRWVGSTTNYLKQTNHISGNDGPSSF